MNTGQQRRRLNKLEEELNSEWESGLWTVYGPKWAQDKGADPPPDNLNEPIWAPERGWMEKADTPDTGAIAFYAPSSLASTYPDDTDEDPQVEQD